MKGMKRFCCASIVALAVAWFIAIMSVYLFSPPQLVCVNGNVFDFGIIDEHETLTKEFVVGNDGRKDLLIKAVKKSCGCTKAVIDKKTLKAGETAKLKVTYEARALGQKERVEVLLATNDPQKPYSKFVIQGIVKPRIFWYPQSLSFMSNASTDSMSTKKINLIIDNDKIDIDEIETLLSSDRIHASLQTEDKGYRLDVSPNPSCPIGTWTELIKLSYIVGSETKLVKIPVYVMKR